MVKLRSPVLSLGAKGTISDSITLRESRGLHIAEKKPVPTDRKSLPQMYQRWLYQDYVAWWGEQSLATKAEYRAIGSIYGLTAFQYWMRYHLRALEGIIAWWKMDNIAGGLSIDAGPNALHGTVIGAIDSTLAINGALYFDGLNDQVTCGTSDLLRPTTSFTAELFFKPVDFLAFYELLCNQIGGASGWGVHVQTATNNLIFTYIGCVGATLNAANCLTVDEINHIMCVFDSVAKRRYIYINGELKAWNTYTGAPIPSTEQFRIGVYRGTSGWTKGTIDNVIIWNRALTQADAIRHSLRRYVTP